MSELKDKIKWFMVIILTIIFDALLLSFWVSIQFLVDTFIVNKLALSGFNKKVLDVMYCIFAISTLLPIVIFIIEDVALLIIKSYERIKKQLK